MRLISATSVLVLLCLPAENCPPPELPWARPFALGPDPAREPRPRTAEPAPQRLPVPCPEGGPGAPQELRRQARAPGSPRRKDGRPNSLDLTFHLLREFLEMSREERLAQKALSNKWLLHSIGK